MRASTPTAGQSIHDHCVKTWSTYRLLTFRLLSDLDWDCADVSSAFRGRPWLMRFKVSGESNELLGGRSRTRKEDPICSSESSSTLPADLRLGKALGSLIGMYRLLQGK